MPQIIFTPKAMRDLQRTKTFLKSKDANAARRAAATIWKEIQILGLQPQIGRLIEGVANEFREWNIDFGDSGYVIRYRLENESVIILALRHQKEAGF